MNPTYPATHIQNSPDIWKKKYHLDKLPTRVKWHFHTLPNHFCIMAFKI